MNNFHMRIIKEDDLQIYNQIRNNVSIPLLYKIANEIYDYICNQVRSDIYSNIYYKIMKDMDKL